MKKTENIIGRLVGGSFRSLRRRLAYNLSKTEYNIVAEQGIVLLGLSHFERLNQQMLTEFIHCDKTAMTRWIDSLESMDFVKRVPDTNDRRQNILELRPKGKEIAKEFVEIALLTEKQAFQGIDKEHIKICKDVLKQITINLETTN